MNFLEFLQHTELYHGSKSSEVTGEIRVGERDSGWYGRGFYLTANKDYAKRWGPNIFKMSVPFGNYAEVNHKDNTFDHPIFIGDSELAERAANEKAGSWIENETLWSKTFSDYLKNKGYVGVRVNLPSHKDVEVVVFDPKDIKVIGKLEESSFDNIQPGVYTHAGYDDGIKAALRNSPGSLVKVIDPELKIIKKHKKKKKGLYV